MGVLNLDGFESVKTAPYDPQPEPGLLEFLKFVSRVLGTLIDKKAKKDSINNLAKIARNVNATFEEIFAVVFNCIQENMKYCGDIVVAQIFYENHISAADLGPRLLYSRGDPKKIKDHMAFLKTYHPIKSNQKPVQVKGDAGNMVWLLCKTKPVERTGQGPIHIIALSQSVFIPEPDLEFLEQMQKIVAAMIQNSVTKKKRAQARMI
jgi:hypothetical protein